MTNRNHILVDTNVLIGYIANLPVDRSCLQFLFSLPGKRIFISALSIAQIVSMFQKKKSDAELRKLVHYFLAKTEVLGFSNKDVEAALLLESTDLEDNIQYVIGKKMQCFWVVTHNKKDYVQFFNIMVATPEDIKQTITHQRHASKKS
jgi:predicted nucleic acid-binding protein